VPDDDYSWLAKPVPVLWITLPASPPIPNPGQPKTARPKGNLKVIQDHDGSPVTSIEGKPIALDFAITIEGRGSSSFTAGTKFAGQIPYNIEFHDGNLNGVGKSLLGMPQNADWALVTCVSDKTCMRNALTYAIGRELVVPQGRWAPRFRWAEVYINGDYRGVYTVAEKPKDDKFRVNLPNVPDTATPAENGYLISADSDCRAALGFDPLRPATEFLDARAEMSRPPTGMGCATTRVPGNRRWVIRAPNDEKLTPAHVTYIKQAFDKMTATVEAATGDWRSAVDLNSFRDYFIISELTNNVDAFFKSFYLYKTPESAGNKWYMGPIWDFDLAYGNANYYYRYCATNTQLGPLVKPSPGPAQDDAAPPWALAPLRDTAFANDLRCRWNNLRTSGPLDIAKIEQRIDAFAAHIKTAKTRDAAKYRNFPKYVWPNNYVGNSWEDEIRYLKFWIRTRLAWIDKTLKGQCAAPASVPAVAQVPAPPNATGVDRSGELYTGERADVARGDYVDILSRTPANLACPPP
jgi:hypothetical protein